MEEWGKENPGTLNCSFAQILPPEILEKVVLALVDESETSDIAFKSLKSFEYVDRETSNAIKSSLAQEAFSNEIQKKLVKKLERDLYLPKLASNLATKFLCPTSTLSMVINLAQAAYRQHSPNIARFFYPYVRDDNKNNFFEIANEKNDSKTAVFCLNHGANANILCVYWHNNKMDQQWTPLTKAIDFDNVDLVKKLLACNADPNKKLKRKRKEGIGGHVIEYYMTPCELAHRKGNQEIIELLENHSRALAKE